MRRLRGRGQSPALIEAALHFERSGKAADGSVAGDPAMGARRRLSVSEAFGKSFWVFVVLAVATGAACYWVLGPEVFVSALKDDFELLVDLMPRFAAAVLMAAFIQVLLPRDLIARYVSDEAGARGLVIATGVGMATPGGPMTSFPIVRALQDAGTGRAPLITYVTSWSTLGFQRAISWELPLLGTEFAAVRVAASLPLPIIAGLMSRLWPTPKRQGGDG